MKRALLTGAIFIFLLTEVCGQTVTLIKDINTGTNASGSSPANFTNVAGTVFFTANDPEHGTELWKTNGTGAGTTLVSDIYPGSSSSLPSQLLAVGTTLYFRANDGVNGSELWKSDGTAAGTVMVKDINPGGSSSTPNYLINVSGTIYFSAYDGTNGFELWKSDGTSVNTTMIADIYTPGNNSSSPSYLTNANGTVYFQAYHPSYGYELWKSTGGAATLVKDIYSGTSSASPSLLTAVSPASSSVILFSAYDATNGQELWRSDGTAAGTYVISINAGAASSNPNYLTAASGTVYFSATTATQGTELWKSTGSSASIVQDFIIGVGSSSPQSITAAGSTIYFSAADALADRELYKSTGSSVTLVSNINSSTDSNPSDFEAVGSTVYFSATTNSNGVELFTSNGTTTTWLADINPGSGSSYPTNKAYVSGNLYLAADNGTSGTELYLYNGTTTSLLKDINGGSEDASPSYFINNGTNIFFRATTNAEGAELWSSSGTSVTTNMIKDIYSGTTGSNAYPFAYNNSLLFLQANDGTKGYELWKSDNTLAGTVIREINTVDETGSNPGTDYAILGSYIYFSADHPTYGRELWKSDGTTTSLVSDIYTGANGSYPSGFTTMGSYVYFTAANSTDGYELWRTSGSGATEVRDINIAAGVSSSPGNITLIGSTLFFSCNNGSDGTELYKSDGTSGGTLLVKDITIGSGSSFPSNLTNVNGTLFFRASDGVNGSELWKSDGTNGGTVLVKDIYTGSSSSNPSFLTPVGSTLYFMATDVTYGGELYKSDGTTGGTILVKDITPGAVGTSLASLTNINGTLYFRGSGTSSGLSLMKTNGTSAGTIVASSSGQTYQNPANITYLGGKVIFTGTTNTYGVELLSVAAEPLNQPTALTLTGPTATSLNVSFTAAAGSPSGYITIRNAGSAPTGLPVDGPAYSVGATLASGTGIVANVSASTAFTSTGLSANTTYYYAIYSYYYDGVAYIYKPHLPLQGNASTLAAVPTTQASSIVFSSVAPTSMTVSWTNGNGSERLVIAGTAAISTDPTPGTSYTGNAAYGSAPSIGAGKVVYRGSGNSVAVSGLSNSTTYYFRVYELNGSGALTNYSLVTATGNPASQVTLAVNPNQPTSLVFSSVTNTSMTLSYTAASGGVLGYIAVRRAGSAPTDLPVNLTNYSAGNTLTPSGDVVVYVGAGLTFNQAGLSPGTNYYYAIYSYNAGPTYATVGPLTGNQYTLSNEPTAQPTAMTFSNPTSSSLNVGYTAAAGPPSGYLVIRKAGSAPVLGTDTPVDGAAYSIGNAIGGSTVAYSGSGTSFSDAGLASNTIYYYAIFSYNGAAAATLNYFPTSPLQGNRTTLELQPTNQPSGLLFSSITTTGFTVDFTDASPVPDGYLVLRRQGSAVADVPADGTSYTAGTAVGSSTVAYVGTTPSFPQSSLTAGTLYYYAAFSFDGSGLAVNYLTTGQGTGSQSTLAAEPTNQPTGLSFSSRTSSSLGLSWTAATGSPGGYLVLRNSGVSPAGQPADGVTYSVGNLIGADIVAYVGSGTSFNDAGLTDETEYFYDVLSYNGTTGSYNYLTSLTPLQGSAFTLALTPGDQPTAIVFSAKGSNQVAVGWTAASSSPAGYIVMRRDGSAPTGTPTDGVSYAAGASIGNGTVAYAGPDVTFTDLDPSLTAEHTYVYRVMSFNGSATSSRYLTTAPLDGTVQLLATEPTGQPSALLFKNLTSSSFTVSFANAPNSPSGYLAISKAGSAAPSGVPSDGVAYSAGQPLGDGTVAYSGSLNSFDETFAPGTFSYAIFSYNGVTNTYNYLTTNPLTGTLTPDSTPPVISDKTGSLIGSGLGLTVAAQVTESESQISSVQLGYRSIVAGGANTSAAMTFNVGSGFYEAAVPGNQIGELGIEYTITATNSQSLQASVNGVVGVTFGEQSFTFSGFGPDQENYRIVSVPLVNKTVGEVFVDDLGSVDDTKWRMFQFQNGTDDAYTEMTSGSSLDLGKGYWLIAKTQTDIDLPAGTAAAASAAQPFGMSLTTGWNLIGNPYLFNILWSDVQSANSNTLKLRTYDGNFKDGTIMKKFEGGFVNSPGNITLSIPVVKNPAAGRVGDPVAGKVMTPIDQPNWTVGLTLINGTRVNVFGGVGMNEQAMDQYDQYDDFTLPRFLDYLELNHDKYFAGSHYTLDCVPSQPNYTWTFSVESSLSGITRMVWDNSYFGDSDKWIMLVDGESGEAINMRQTAIYSFVSRPSHKFKVVYGSKQYVEETAYGDRIIISNVYPNPSDGAVNIGFMLPSSASGTAVQVKIINMMGQIITRVFDGNLGPGYNERVWNGLDPQNLRPAQGIYLVQVQAGNTSVNQRVILK